VRLPWVQAVGFETEATAIIDTLNYIRPAIHTLVIGQARPARAAGSALSLSRMGRADLHCLASVHTLQFLHAIITCRGRRPALYIHASLSKSHPTAHDSGRIALHV